MKGVMSILSVMIVTILFTKCEKMDVSEKVDSTLTGTWKLVKISYGYPAPNMPTFTTNVADITYEFDESKSYYMYKQNGKVVDEGNYTTEMKKNENYTENFLTFTKLDIYTTYSLDSESQELILYERMPIGTMIADGSNYHYKKIK